MPVIITPSGGTTWASLSFGDPYMKMRATAAPTADKGIVQADLDYACERSQYRLEPMFRRYFSKTTLAGWTGANIPPRVANWANQLAAAYVHHGQSAENVDRRKAMEEWAKTILDEIEASLKAGELLLNVSGDVITPLDRPTSSRRVAMALVSSPGEVFDQGELENLQENHGPNSNYDWKWDSDNTYPGAD
jgi:hypothetical protein